ncbi:TPA: MAE_28990/MAE_18760 family HEPN-like nuclease [Vibrio alginolyticus]
MSLESFQEQLEVERTWREDEIRFLDNLQREYDEEKRFKFRRSIMCLYYAHIEGFVQFAFSLYVDEINKQELKCSEVKPVIAAATLHNEFMALQNKDKKSKIFKKTLPDETHIHRLSRQVEFVESFSLVNDLTVIVPDGYINTESNVGKQVLEKLLYQVGLEYDDLKHTYGSLNKLLNTRNDIAHGKKKYGINDEDYTNYHTCCLGIIQHVSQKLTTAYGHNRYLKTT